MSEKKLTDEQKEEIREACERISKEVDERHKDFKPVHPATLDFIPNRNPYGDLPKQTQTVMSKELTFPIDIGEKMRESIKEHTRTEFDKFVEKVKNMSKELTFKEILSELYNSERISSQQCLNGNDDQDPQIRMFKTLRILADYFNGENNWVPEGNEVRFYPRIMSIGKLSLMETRISIPLPPFKWGEDLDQAITIIERDFPELIESFTKKK